MDNPSVESNEDLSQPIAELSEEEILKRLEPKDPEEA